jgi:hypothetical protein
MQKLLLILLAAVITAILISVFGYEQKVKETIKTVAGENTLNVNAMEDQAIATYLAREAFLQAKADEVDFSQGPCISDNLMPGWVVDMVHTPRLAIDDKKENKCPAIVSGRVKHLIELDTKGNLVNIY